MKTATRIFVILAILSLMCQPVLNAQTIPEDIIFKAMNDELNRNLSQLKINAYRTPFFISYQFNDGQKITVRATLGAIQSTDESPVRIQNVRLMAGDYSLNYEDLAPSGLLFGSGSLALPLENDYNAIRRAFWFASDRRYKRAINSYDQKISALKQQNKAAEEKLDDYWKITPVSLVINCTKEKYDKPRWEAVARDISSVFKAHSQISNSSVVISLMNTIVYITSSEGLKLKIPLSIASMLVNASIQAEDGDILNDQLRYYALTPEQLPTADKVKQDIKQMADHISALSKAPLMKDAYSGPVIFEGEAVAELFIQKLFRNNGLVAYREPDYAVRQNYGSIIKMDDKINQRIFSENITIKETPKLKIFNNTPLIGTFEIDSEGVVPKDELILVDKGILKTMLNDRVPTKKILESNGHSRFTMNGIIAGAQKAPGVINVYYNKGESARLLRKAVLKKAAKDGLEYIYVIRKFEDSRPIGVYQVSIKTGEEQLIRSAIISDFQMSRFKYITLGTREQIVYNTLLNSSIPVSFIVPQALVFDDISIEKNKNVKSKLPLVSNPLISQNEK